MNNFKKYDIVCSKYDYNYNDCQITTNYVGYITSSSLGNDVNVYFFDTQSHSSYHYSHLRKIEYKND